MTTDPNKWVTSPPSTLVQLQDLQSQPALNGKYGVVLQYHDERYLVQVLLLLRLEQQQPRLVKLQPKNLTSDLGLQGWVKARIALLQSDPTIQKYVRKVDSWTRQNPKLLQGGAVGGVVALLLSIYFLGFIGTAVLLSLVILGGTFWLKFTMEGGVHGLPPAARRGIAWMSANKRLIVPVLVAAAAAAYGGYAVYQQQTTAMSPPEYHPVENDDDPMPRQGVTHRRTTERERLYKLGFDDATAGKEYGTSLEEDEPSRAFSWEQEPVYSTAPPPKESSSSPLTNLVSVVLSGGLVAFQIYQIDPTFSNQALIVSTISNMTVWKKGMLAFSAYRFVTSVVKLITG